MRSTHSMGPQSEPVLLEDEVLKGERVLLHSPTFCVVDHESLAGEARSASIKPFQAPRVEYPRRQYEVLAEGYAPLIADPTRVLVFGEKTVCRRRAKDPLGVRATVISFRTDALSTLVPHLSLSDSAHDNSRAMDVSSPLALRLHEESVALVNRLSSGVPFDWLAAEEATSNLLLRTLQAHTAWNFSVRSGHKAPSQLEMVAAVKQFISKNLGQRMSLSTLARQIGVSPFYLCRFFRATTGQTVYQYQLQLRLTAALEKLPEYEGKLAALAMDLGFSSHSHLTTLFKRAYGYSPGGARQRRRSQGLSLGGSGI